MDLTTPVPVVATNTVRKIRHRIIPLVFLGFIAAFLDRINIDFAALTMWSGPQFQGSFSTMMGVESGVALYLGRYPGDSVQYRYLSRSPKVPH